MHVVLPAREGSWDIKQFGSQLLRNTQETYFKGHTPNLDTRGSGQMYVPVAAVLLPNGPH
eukprot:1051706-Amphidinium_carterae.1